METNENADSRPVIVWDVDDVLNNLAFEWFKEFEELHHSGVSYEQLSANPPDKILGIPLDSYLESLDDFRSRKMSELKPVNTVLEWFHAHGADFRHAALTAVPFHFAPLSAQWVMKNFGNWIRSFHFVPSFRKDDNIVAYDKSKADMLKRIGRVDAFIDDNEFNIAQAGCLGICSIAFPRPWNKNRGMAISECLSKLEKLKTGKGDADEKIV